ncbi:MAG: hypothetical protein H6739_40935 [Alphaproteobacteria bacterium]|nr:hypothetical protein [Alphaproteobacteria bacterium]
MRTRLLLVTLALAACSEYEVKFRKDQNAGLDSGPAGCEEPDLSPGVVAVDDTCTTAIVELEPVLEWADRSVHDVYNTPVIGQLTDDNGDGLVDDADIPDIVTISEQAAVWGAELRVISGDGSGTHWIRDDRVHHLTHPAIGDVNGDGRPDVVASVHDERAYDAYVAYDGATGDVLWIGGQDDAIMDVNLGLIGLYDLEGDGTVEVVIGDLILEGATGEVRGHGGLGIGSNRSWATSAPMSVAADLDGDGVQEVLAGNTAYGPDASVLWWNQEHDGAVAVGNFDDDPEGEMVVATFNGEIRLQDTDGTVLWKKVVDEQVLGPPAVADVDGDGSPEIAVSGTTHIYALDATGDILWTQEIAAICSGGTGVSAFDFEGDGVVEWISADDFDILILDGPTGAVRARIEEHSHRGSTVYPTVADVDGDGSAELVVSEVIWTGPERGIQVFGHPGNGWMPARPTWNQHGYGRTQADDVGRIVTAPDPPWQTQNSYRAGELGRAENGSLPLPDAALQLVDACACDEGRVRVVVRVANEGLAELPAGVRVALGVGDNGAWLELADAETEAPVPSGATSEGIVFVLRGDDLISDTLTLRVEGVTECDADDDTLTLEVPSCD